MAINRKTCLITKRKKDQSVFIGQDVQILINKIEDGYVSLVIKAPENVRIRIENEKRDSPRSS